VGYTNAKSLHKRRITTFDEEEKLLAEAFPVNTFKTVTTIIDCSNDSDILTIDYIKISPDPPLKGQDLEIEAVGYLKETIGEGSYIDLTVKLGLIKLLQQRLDLCEQVEKVGKKCPLEKGRQELKHTVTLPKEIPYVSIILYFNVSVGFVIISFNNSFSLSMLKGKYTAEAFVYTPEQNRITCLKAVAIFRP